MESLYLITDLVKFVGELMFNVCYDCAWYGTATADSAVEQTREAIAPISWPLIEP